MPSPTTRARMPRLFAFAILTIVALAALGVWGATTKQRTARVEPSPDPSNITLTTSTTTPTTNQIEFPKASWDAAGIQMEPVEKKDLAISISLTGKIALNEDRVAHVFPLVEGRVEDVKIRFGDKVKQGALLVIVQSKEVGQAKLQLFQDRMQLEFATERDHWTQSVTDNTLSMIKKIREGADINEIETDLSNRTMGEYRDRLMTAFINQYKSRKHLDRLTPLSAEGAVSGKQLLDADSEWNAARATLQSLVEQVQQDAKQAAAISTQQVKELQTRVSVDETNLRILGFDQAAIEHVSPEVQGEAISHYPIYSPFDGTIISKDVALLERVGPERQILSVADLSTVWVSTDVYEEHLPLLQQLKDQTIEFHCDAFPGETFKATIFYSGDLVDESTRTISMKAMANNESQRLKPGMFVNVILPNINQTNVLQVPLSAIQDHDGITFVFVHTKEESFEKREIKVGKRNENFVEVRDGLDAGERVVIRGGFALKSHMLAELLSE